MRTLSYQDELQAAHAGDAEALEDLLALSRQDIRRYAEYHCGVNDIEDAVQEALLLVSRKLTDLSRNCWTNSAPCAGTWPAPDARDAVQPESPVSPSPTDTLRHQQDALAAYIRDPANVAPPAGFEERRLKVYRDLFFNNISGMLAGNFPVIQRLYGQERWQALMRGFYRDHDSRTPLFTELAREFLRYLESCASREDRRHPPRLRDLAHYEWIELALQISEASDTDIAHDPEGDLLAGRPVLSPLAWPLAYAWPVHRIGPEFLPEAPPQALTLLLVHRDAGDRISFHELSPLTYRLLQRLDEAPELTGQAQLHALAGEANRDDVDAFGIEGVAMLEHWRKAGIVLGTRLDPCA